MKCVNTPWRRKNLNYFINYNCDNAEFIESPIRQCFDSIKKFPKQKHWQTVEFIKLRFRNGLLNNVELTRTN